MKIFLGVLVTLVLLVVAGLAFVGYIPIPGFNNPRDLGIRYTEADRTAAQAKTQVEYVALPANVPDEQSLQWSGSRPATLELSSAEATALVNDRPYKYWPFKDVQVKYNADGSAEISGRFIKSRIPGFSAANGIPKEVVTPLMAFLPPDPTFYVKSKASLTNNTVSQLDPSALEIGHLPIPLDLLLSQTPLAITPAYAADSSSLEASLASVSGKKAIIIEYINARLAQITGFFAKSASFGDNKLLFDGTLSEQELTAR